MDDSPSEQNQQKIDRARHPTVVIDDTEYVIFSIDAPSADLSPSLTDAERDIIAGVLAGLSNADIAERRGVSPNTVANQLATIFDKLGVGDRAELAARAL